MKIIRENDLIEKEIGVGSIVTFEEDLEGHFLVITNHMPSETCCNDVFSYNLLCLEESNTYYSRVVDSIEELIGETRCKVKEVINPKNYFLKITK